MSRAGEQEVRLPDHRTLTVKTFLGEPVHHVDSHIRVTQLRPAFGFLQDWRVDRMVWTLHGVSTDRKIKARIRVRSLLNPGLAIERDFSTEAPPDATSVGAILEFFPNRKFPEAWKFLTEPGDSWIPFEVTVDSDIPKASYTFIDCARVTEAQKKVLREVDERQKHGSTTIPTKRIQTSTGQEVDLAFAQGQPWRFADSNFQVDAFSPAYDQRSQGMDAFVWVLAGRIRDCGPCRIEVLPINEGSGPFQTLDFKGDGLWQVTFGERAKHPELWDWVGNSKEEWIVVKVRLTELETGHVREWHEGCRIDKNARRTLANLTAR